MRTHCFPSDAGITIRGESKANRLLIFDISNVSSLLLMRGVEVAQSLCVTTMKGDQLVEAIRRHITFSIVCRMFQEFPRAIKNGCAYFGVSMTPCGRTWN